MVLLAVVPVLRRQGQHIGGDEDEVGAEVIHSLDQRVDRAPKSQIPHHRDREILQPALCPADRVEVEHRLRGVLIGTIAGIDDRDLGHLTGILRSPLEEVTHDDQVGVVGDHLDRVVQVLALRRATGTGVGEADHTAAQTIDSGLEAEARPGGGLKKKRRRHATL